jgi:hypothetical protein
MKEVYARQTREGKPFLKAKSSTTLVMTQVTHEFNSVVQRVNSAIAPWAGEGIHLAGG